KDFSGRFFISRCSFAGWHFCFSSKKKKLKGAKNSQEKIFLWAILMFLRLAFGKALPQFPNCG
ncbi:MAG: hypothetical protein NTZ78_14890, partial [Candidatus Aureabacteria bacterium]|nr:hypothetical protein [Candidatus Auribacterota bacterium]